MEHNMILSASGWRKVFAESKMGEDNSPAIGTENRRLCVLIAETFARYIKEKTGKKSPVVTVGTDTRPTGPEIADAVLRSLNQQNVKVRYLGVTAAPEIMAYARKTDGFLYISASHNPVGHNGIKFGLNDGGVVPAPEAKKLIDDFKTRLVAVNAEEHADEVFNLKSNMKAAEKDRKHSPKFKQQALEAYTSFIKTVVTGTEKAKEQEKILAVLKTGLDKQKISVVCDMNGSARTASIDSSIFSELNIGFLPFNNMPGQIVHAIIPEPENLVYCASTMEDQQKSGRKDAVLGYMPDCDGDRGNVVYWNEKTGKAEIIPAQEVFALSILSELTWQQWKQQFLYGKRGLKKAKETAVAVNCPTSMRIDDICSALNVKVFRGEVGEANVVNLAREKREAGFNVPILGEGSNGGNITYPSAVRDPLATVFAFVKLLTVRDMLAKDGSIQKGLYHIWCEKKGIEYSPDFTLQDVIDSLPEYTTTGVSEPRAVLQVKTEDKGKLKLRFQKIFENEWKEKASELEEKYGIVSYEADITNGTKEVVKADNWNNGNGGLKVKFFDASDNPVSFIWMRPSGTESVFRVMCDVKGNKPNEEKSLLEWETSILLKADAITE